MDNEATTSQKRLLQNRNNLGNNKSITMQSSIPHDEMWYRRGKAAYAGLNRTDPDAHWMYQGFAFVDWKTKEQASYVKGFVDSVPHGNFIVIDMAYSPSGEWQKWDNASFFGAVSNSILLLSKLLKVCNYQEKRRSHSLFSIISQDQRMPNIFL